MLSIFIGLKLLLYETEPLGFDALLTRPFRAMSDVRGLIPDEFLVIVVILVVDAPAHIGTYGRRGFGSRQLG